METNPTRMCELLVGLPAVNVLGVEDDEVCAPLVVHVESRRDQARCPGCGARGQRKDRAAVELVDLPAFGRPARLVWHKQRWWCPVASCAVGSWTVTDDAIAPPRQRLTDRAARWATRQVGKAGRPVAEIAHELSCDWHTVMGAVSAYGEALLAQDSARTTGVEALGLDETLFVRRGERHRKHSLSVNMGDCRPIQAVAKASEACIPMQSHSVLTRLLSRRSERMAGAGRLVSIQPRHR